MKLGIGLLGLGTVGSGFLMALEKNKEYWHDRTGYDVEVRKILVRDPSRPRPVEVDAHLITTSYSDILTDSTIDVVIEVMGGLSPAQEYIEKALTHGKHVITANKALLAHCGNHLRSIAKANGVSLRYEASVAGAIPIITVLDRALPGERIEEVFGIINGTTNYILSRMSEEKADYGDVLADAQRLGFAEADPTADVEAYDATYKLCILIKKAFGCEISAEEVYRTGITRITGKDIELAERMGFRIKLLAVGKKCSDQLEARVQPTLLPESNPLSRISGPFNGVFLKGNLFGDMMLYGRGAGDLPTASAVVGDLLSLIRENYLMKSNFDFDFVSEANIKSSDAFSLPRFLRFSGKPVDNPIEKISRLAGEMGIPLRKVTLVPEIEDSICGALLTEAIPNAMVDSFTEKLLLSEGLRVDQVLCAELNI